MFLGVLHKVYCAAIVCLKILNMCQSDIVKLNVFESYVFLILTYAIDSVDLSQKQINELSVCYNNMFRCIFGLHKWESC